MVLETIENNDGLPTGTRTQSSRLGGGSFIQLNYGEVYSTQPFYYFTLADDNLVK